MGGAAESLGVIMGRTSRRSWSGKTQSQCHLITNLPSCVAEIRSGRATSRPLPRVMKAVSQLIANQGLWVDNSLHSLGTWHENCKAVDEMSCISSSPDQHPSRFSTPHWNEFQDPGWEIISDRMHLSPRDWADPGERVMGAQVSTEVTLGQVGGDIIWPVRCHIVYGVTHLSTEEVTGAGPTGLCMCYTNSPEAGELSIMWSVIMSPELRPDPDHAFLLT